MEEKELSIVERKVLGALLILSNDNKIVIANMQKIANTLGYKKTGGILTYALKILEMKNYIVRIDKNKFQVLI